MSTKPNSSFSYQVKNTITGYKVGFRCPGCQERLSETIEKAGQPDRCPVCGATFILPGQNELKKLQTKKEEAQRRKELQRQQRAAEREAKKQSSIEERNQRRLAALANKKEMEEAAVQEAANSPPDESAPPPPTREDKSGASPFPMLDFYRKALLFLGYPSLIFGTLATVIGSTLIGTDDEDGVSWFIFGAGLVGNGIVMVLAGEVIKLFLSMEEHLRMIRIGGENQ
ncbi:MAG: hypothetical protein F9B45_32135 [Phycisphaera sp. RhM]|nr:hypothetical protein [Phycisphaera sp. RhM]